MTFKEQSPASDGKSCEVPKRQGENEDREYFAHLKFSPDLEGCQGMATRFYTSKIKDICATELLKGGLNAT